MSRLSGFEIGMVSLFPPRTSPELILQPVVISRNENEKVLVETSINSVRISIKIKQVDDIEKILCQKFSRFLMQRAEHFFILRRKPIPVSRGALSSMSMCCALWLFSI